MNVIFDSPAEQRESLHKISTNFNIEDSLVDLSMSNVQPVKQDDTNNTSQHKEFRVSDSTEESSVREISSKISSSSSQSQSQSSNSSNHDDENNDQSNDETKSESDSEEFESADEDEYENIISKKKLGKTPKSGKTPRPVKTPNLTKEKRKSDILIINESFNSSIQYDKEKDGRANKMKQDDNQVVENQKQDVDRFSTDDVVEIDNDDHKVKDGAEFRKAQKNNVNNSIYRTQADIIETDSEEDKSGSTHLSESQSSGEEEDVNSERDSLNQDEKSSLMSSNSKQFKASNSLQSSRSGSDSKISSSNNTRSNETEEESIIRPKKASHKKNRILSGSEEESQDQGESPIPTYSNKSELKSDVKDEISKEASKYFQNTKKDTSDLSLIVLDSGESDTDNKSSKLQPPPQLQKPPIQVIQVKPEKKTLIQTTILPNGMITPLKLNKYSEDRAIGGYSPNSFPVKTKDEKKPNLTSGIKMMSMDDKEQDHKMAAAFNGNKTTFNASSLQAAAMRGATTQMNNKYLSYEEKLKELSKSLIEEMESKPDPDASYENIEMPSCLKVKLMTHQLYSMKWLKWCESRYPSGGI